MPWVTFGCRDILGVAIGIGANIKDENYFAQQSLGKSANSHPGRTPGMVVAIWRRRSAPELNLRGASLP